MRRIVLLTMVLVCFWPLESLSQSYKFEKGKKTELCELYFGYYKKVMSVSLYEMACERPTDPEFSEIKRPKWEILDLAQHKELIKRIYKFLDYGGDQFVRNPDLDDEGLFKSYFDDLIVRADVARFSTIDIDNDGKAENVLLYQRGLCREAHVYSKPLLVLNEDKTLIDPDKTEPLLQNPSIEDTLKAKVVENHYRLYDAFFYKGRTYFDRLDVRTNSLSVFENSNGTVKELCRYKCLERCWR